MAAIATFALKAGLWFRRGRLNMVAPRFPAIFLPISSGFTTQRPCPDFPSHLSAVQTAANLITTGVLVALLAGIAMKLRWFGPNP
jgi:hypothetical protein